MHQILVGTNESEEAASALRWASTLAGGIAADMTIVEAFRPREAERPPERARQIEEQIGQQVETWTSRFELEAPVSVCAIEGSPGSVLPEVARNIAASLVVVGSRPHEGATSLGLGSLAHSLAHHLECPLVAVPNTANQLIGGWLIVGVDGSDSSLLALQWSETLARQLGARVCAVHHADNVRDPVRTSGWHGGKSVDWRDFMATVDFVERTDDDPAALLRAVADERDAGLIVVAARERHSLSGHLLGLVPDGLLHHPTHPVAVLPHALAGTAPVEATRQRALSRH